MTTRTFVGPERTNKTGERNEAGPFGYNRRNARRRCDCLGLLGQSGQPAQFAYCARDQGRSQLKARLRAQPLHADRTLIHALCPSPSTWAQGRASRPLSRISPSISRLRERNCLPFTPNWIGRYDRRGVKLLLRSWLFNVIARIIWPSVFFTNQHRSRCRLAAGGAGFGYMRNGQKKKDHECCAAHFFIYSCDEELEGAGHALLI
jgi:hypothetical protein